MSHLLMKWRRALFFAMNYANAKAPFRKIVYIHLRRYPQMEIRDVYKLSHQAAMGNTHLGADRAKIYDALKEEFEQIQAFSAEPFLETLSPDGVVVRVNLRPFKALQGDLDALCKAMLQSAKTFKKSPDRLERYWSDIEDMAIEGLIPYEVKALQLFMATMRKEVYPSIHHSAFYREHYRPTYRVILKQYVPQMPIQALSREK